MKPTVIAILPAFMTSLLAMDAVAQNAATAPARGPIAYGAPAQSRVQQWYSDTGWQPGHSAIQSHGYGYGYGGTEHAPQAVVVASHEPLHTAYSRSQYSGPTRSMPFGYVVDGFGRYPWQGGAVYQNATQREPSAPVASSGYHHDHSGHDGAHCPHHPHAPTSAPAPMVAPAPSQPADSGYFAVPERAPISSTEIPYQQEPGERG